jgi:triosephosphate isomerase
MKYPNKYLIANWKTNPQTLAEAKELIKIGLELGDKIAHYAVPAPFLGLLGTEFAPVIGSQTVSGLESGAETGLFTASQIKETGSTFTLVGHSEDRKRGATDEFIKQAVEVSLKNNLYVCLCVGEVRPENFEQEVTKQLDSDLEGLGELVKENKIMFAYEPVWAIGKDAKRAATGEEITGRLNFIQKYLQDKFGVERAYILYGGSVDAGNIEEILQLDSCDGVLIGRASADKEKWGKIVEVLKSNDA